MGGRANKIRKGKKVNLNKKILSSQDKVRIYEVLKRILNKSRYRKASASMEFIEDKLKYTLSIEKHFVEDIEHDSIVTINLNETSKGEESNRVTMSLKEEGDGSNEVSLLSELVEEVWEK